MRVLLNAVPDVHRNSSWAAGMRFGYIGSFGTCKGVDTLLEAFRQVRQRDPSALLTLAGKTETTAGQTLKAKYGSDAGLIWLGEVQGAAKQSFFDSIHVLCVPSLDEPSGLTVLEGAMQGKAVVTTDHVGANYVVDEGSGRVVTAGSVPELAQVLIELSAAGDAHLRDLGRGARRNYLRFGTTERERQEVLALLEENRGRIPAVRGRLRSDEPFFHRRRMPDGRTLFYAGNVRVFSRKGVAPAWGAAMAGEGGSKWA